MLTVEQVEQWRTQHGYTRKSLAEALGCSYPGLVDVLNGKRPLSRAMASRIEQLMANEPKGLMVQLPPDELAKLKDWATSEGITPEEMAERIIAHVLGI